MRSRLPSRDFLTIGDGSEAPHRLMQPTARPGDAVNRSNPDLPAELADLAREHGRVAIDTEFVSEGRYRALLCLVQVALAPRGEASEPRIELLDPIGDGFDPGPLAAV